MLRGPSLKASVMVRKMREKYEHWSDHEPEETDEEVMVASCCDSCFQCCVLCCQLCMGEQTQVAMADSKLGMCSSDESGLSLLPA